MEGSRSGNPRQGLQTQTSAWGPGGQPWDWGLGTGGPPPAQLQPWPRPSRPPAPPTCALLPAHRSVLLRMLLFCALLLAALPLGTSRCEWLPARSEARPPRDPGPGKGGVQSPPLGPPGAHGPRAKRGGGGWVWSRALEARGAPAVAGSGGAGCREIWGCWPLGAGALPGAPPHLTPGAPSFLSYLQLEVLRVCDHQHLRLPAGEDLRVRGQALHDHLHP